MKVKPMPPISLINQLLDYDPVTGLFRWKVAKANRVKVGSIAGSIRNDGYLEIRINYCSYMAHRLAYYIVTGDQPPEVDHKNGIRNDNRIINLRAANSKLNSNNHKKQKRNKSGVTGIGWHKRDNCWETYYSVNGKQIHYYNKDFFEAICWRKSMEYKYGMTYLKKHRQDHVPR
jgi:hypothetical protein